VSRGKVRNNSSRGRETAGHSLTYERDFKRFGEPFELPEFKYSNRGGSPHEPIDGRKTAPVAFSSVADWDADKSEER
jgi:hypothetical protein